MFTKMLKEQILLEISLRDHYDKFVQDKTDISFDEYQKLAMLDPTSSIDRKGKYVDWIINLVKKEKEQYGIIRPKPDLKNQLQKFQDWSQGKSITEFKTFQDFNEYVDELKPVESKREMKKKSKDIFNSPDDIKILDNTDEWIVIETLTREGNIKGAQYRTSPQSDWCTAYLDTDSHWKNYSRRGDLIQFINKQDPYEKYQIFVQDGKIIESRDYKDRTDNKPHQLIKNELPEFDTNYGKIEERPPFKYIYDEEGTAGSLLSDNWDQDQEYLNRQPDEDEYEYYYEEASNNAEYQINHWDRFLKAGLEIYQNESDNKYTDIHNRMEYFVSAFSRPITGDDSDKEPAAEAVQEMYNEVEDMWREYLEDEEEPEKREGESIEEYDTRKSYWVRDIFEKFKNDSKIVEFMEYFKDDFPYDYTFNTGIESWTKDNSEEQMSFSFESIRKMLAMK